MAKIGKPAKKVASKKSSLSKTEKDEQEVTSYLKKLKHPLKAEFELVRDLIRSSDKKLQERIKWNAPSYHYDNIDLVTFNGWAEKQVHLVFHHPAIVKIKSPILEGDYPTRRMVYFNSMKEVKDKKTELQKVMKMLIKKAIDQK